MPFKFNRYRHVMHQRWARKIPTAPNQSSRHSNMPDTFPIRWVYMGTAASYCEPIRVSLEGFRCGYSLRSRLAVCEAQSPDWSVVFDRRSTSNPQLGQGYDVEIALADAECSICKCFENWTEDLRSRGSFKL
jgi:hypothetical protein